MRWMHAGRVAAALALGAALVAAPALAQGRKGGGMGMGMGSPRHDTATEATVTGTVEEVQTQQGRMRGTGLHLAVKTATGVLDVHVGPTRWLADQKFEFAKGDALEIVGSKVTVDGNEAFLARQIKKGEQTLTLRNEKGMPKWSRRGAGTD
jgi:hypothetical protein